MYSVYRMFVMRVHIKSFVGALKEMRKLVGPYVEHHVIGFHDGPGGFHVSGRYDDTTYSTGNVRDSESLVAVSTAPSTLIKLLGRFAKDGDAFMSAAKQDHYVALSLPCGIMYRLLIDDHAVPVAMPNMFQWDETIVTDDDAERIRKASRFISYDMGRHILGFVRMTGNAIVSTDTHRMYVSESDGDGFDLLIPGQIAASFNNPVIWINPYDGNSFVPFEYGSVVWGKPKQTFPNWNKIVDDLPKESLTTWRINSKEWLIAARVVQPIAKGNANRVLIDQMSDDVQLSAKTDELFVSVKIPCPSDGFLGATGISVKYLIDAITTLKDPEFTGFNPSRPLRFHSGNEMVIVMPMAVS